jgi:hypothetical protein
VNVPAAHRSAAPHQGVVFCSASTMPEVRCLFRGYIAKAGLTGLFERSSPSCMALRRGDSRRRTLGGFE